MNYAEMSDFEINKAVAFHIGLSTVIAAENLEFNPCNSWADAGPLIELNGMNLVKLRDGNYVCVSEFIDISSPRFSSRDLNPLRAAMVVFLMMNEG